MRLLTILLRYGTTAYPHAEARLGELFDRHMPGVDRDLLIVDNALPPTFVGPTASGRTIIGGNNQHREFSGFDRGMAHVSDRVGRYDLVHFVTDAFDTLYVDYLERFDRALLSTVAGQAVAVGHIDCYNEPIEIFGVHSQHWIRSCYFFMSPPDAVALGSFVSVREPERFFSGDPRAPFRSDAPLSRRYQDYLIDWITGRDIGQGVEWHSGFALSETALAAFEEKARAIMNEQMLGVRLRALGCRLIDVTWLAACVGRAPAAQVAWNTNWRQQLAGRDRSAIVIPV